MEGVNDLQGRRRRSLDVRRRLAEGLAGLGNIGDPFVGDAGEAAGIPMQGFRQATDLGLGLFRRRAQFVASLAQRIAGGADPKHALVDDPGQHVGPFVQGLADLADLVDGLVRVCGQIRRPGGQLFADLIDLGHHLFGDHRQFLGTAPQPVADGFGPGRRLRSQFGHFAGLVAEDVAGAADLFRRLIGGGQQHLRLILEGFTHLMDLSDDFLCSFVHGFGLAAQVDLDLRCPSLDQFSDGTQGIGLALQGFAHGLGLAGSAFRLLGHFADMALQVFAAGADR